ncbi:MAG: hypothetical protein NTAFB09_24410 [Nitrosospira sp.]
METERHRWQTRDSSDPFTSEDRFEGEGTDKEILFIEQGIPVLVPPLIKEEDLEYMKKQGYKLFSSCRNQSRTFSMGLRYVFGIH